MTREQLIERRATAAQQMQLATAERDKQQRTVDTWHGVLQDCDFWLAQMPDPKNLIQADAAAPEKPGPRRLTRAEYEEMNEIPPGSTIKDDLQAAKGA